MANKPAFMGNPFDPLDHVTIVGLMGQREVDLGGPLTQVSPGVWGGDGMMFNSRGVQVMASGEIVRPPAVMAVNRGGGNDNQVEQ